MDFKVIDKDTGKEYPDCIIVKTGHGGYDIYETREDFINGIDVIEKYQSYCDLVMIYR